MSLMVNDDEYYTIGVVVESENYGLAFFRRVLHPSGFSEGPLNP